MQRLSRSLPLSLTAILPALVLASATDAAALKPKKHRRITEQSCEAVGLRADFCRRAGAASFTTDADEWDDMAAHAQTAPGQTTCEGAAATAARLAALGASTTAALQAAAAGGDGEVVAKKLGRILHTVQDNCAHAGMTNPQHAWYSLDDFCHDTEDDPDEQQAAIDCARVQTDLVFAAFAEAIEVSGANAGDLGREVCGSPFDDESVDDDSCDRVWLPLPWDACSFLASSEEWDGHDTRWDLEKVSPVLVAAVGAGLRGETFETDVCQGDPMAIEPVSIAAEVDVGGGPESCTKAHLLCLGKVDDASDFFGDDDDLADEPAAGCAASGRSPGLGGLLLVLGAALTLAERRRRR